MGYNAFISYSHTADGVLAATLQSALHRFAKPWYKLRALHIFRDQTNLAVNPALWSSIRDAIDQSAFFILLASPEAAASPWVAKETEYWIGKNGQSLPTCAYRRRSAVGSFRGCVYARTHQRPAGESSPLVSRGASLSGFTLGARECGSSAHARSALS